MIYLHGFASGPTSKKATWFRERFAAEGVSLAVPDLAEGNFEGLTLEGQLAVVERVADGRTVSLIGSSMGGYLAALYAARYPETVERLVLMAPAFCFAQLWAEMLGPEKVAEWERTGRLPVFHYAENREAYTGWQLMEDARRQPAYPEFRQPALILHGRNDTVVPVALSERLAAEWENVRLEVLDSDHELVDVFEQVWKMSRDFLRS